MRIFKAKTVQLLILFIALPAWSQVATLKGTVTDANSKSGIGGADVTISAPDGSEQKSISAKDGTYTAGNLTRGMTVCVSYSRNGYRPNPRRESVELDLAENTKNVQLYQDTPHSAYWVTWSTGVKYSVEASTEVPVKQTELYDHAWYSLAHIGLSPEAETQAAHQLVYVAPQAARSSRLMRVSNVNIDDLPKAKIEIRAALSGQTKLSGQFQSFVPPEIAAEIAADELFKRPVQQSSRKYFIDEFGNIYGLEGARELQISLARFRVDSCPKSNSGTNQPGQQKGQDNRSN